MRKNQQSRIYYHGGDWHKAAMAVCEIVAFEKGYSSFDPHDFDFTGIVPDVLIMKGGDYWSIEVVDSSPPDNYLHEKIQGVKDTVLVRRADVPDPDSLTAIFAHCRRRIP